MSLAPIDLRHLLPPVGNQGTRNTCMAFAASGAHASVCGQPAPSLSVEFAHYHACHRAPAFKPQEGTSASDMFDALAHAGQPHEAEWPYMPTLPVDLSTYHPPQLLTPTFKHTGSFFARFEDIYDHLANGKCVVLGVQLSVAFHMLTGSAVLAFDPDLNPAGHHAVVAVGARQDGLHDVLLLRNSWGDGWADAGHGHVSEAYLRPRITFMGVINA